MWDVGHQAYAWKLLTGRNQVFDSLRQTAGISGFLRRSESPHDHFGAGHAGTAMSAALGMATARDLTGQDFKVVAVVGDGALTCGLSYEGMNNAGHSERDILLVVNDNGMSISPNVGAISKMFGRVVASPFTTRPGHRKHLTLKAGRGLRRWVVDFEKVEESARTFPQEFFEERFRSSADHARTSKALRTLHLVRGGRYPGGDGLTEKGKGFSLAEEQKVARPGATIGQGEARKKASAPHLDTGCLARRSPPRWEHPD